MNTIKFDFQRDVIDESFKQPIVADFWAAWCAPCRMLGPVLERLDAGAAGRWKLVKVNTEENPQVAATYQIRSIPAVKMFSEGKVVAEFVGALPEPSIRRWLDQNLPTEAKKAVDEAQQLLAQGDDDKAKKILKYAIDQDNSNQDARILLALLVFEDEPQPAIELVGDVDESHKMFDKVDAMRTLARFHQAGAVPDSNDGKAWDAYVNGIAAFKEKDYDKALEQWIDAIIYDRAIDDDGPRRACVSLFKLLGNEHSITQKYHRQFTSALY
ncbi:tetratricopeptide repeat protein [candidate division KSB1 bacterium]|nr:tetratricopeptide repeat protein [candidate division KSB1 bacterium]